jgi:hypothetical protein
MTLSSPRCIGKYAHGSRHFLSIANYLPTDIRDGLLHITTIVGCNS